MTNREWERRTAVREYKAQLIENVLNGIAWAAITIWFTYMLLEVFTG